MLIKVHNDIVTAIDNAYSIILVLLDLSAAFDTVDDRIFTKEVINTLWDFVIRLLIGFVSYLSNRTQSVKVNGNHHISHKAPHRALFWGHYYILYTLLPWAVLPSDII